MNASARAPRWPLPSTGRFTLAEQMALIAAIAFIVCGAGVWVIGELAALVFSGTAPALSPVQVGGVLGRLPGHFSDPRTAWPAGASRLLPGPVGMYAVALLAGVMVALLAVAVLRLASLARHRLARLLKAPGEKSIAASWGRSEQLRPLRVKRAQPDRLVLGRLGSSLVAGEPRQSAIVIAPTGGMKTTGLAIPGLLEWQGPALACSVKTDLLRDTLARRRQLGRVMVYDPTEASSIPGNGWTPLSDTRTWQGAQRTAAWLCTAARSRHSSLADADFWYAAAGKLLAPLLFAAANSDRTMADVVRWVDTQDREEVHAALLDTGVEEAVIAAEASWNRDERQRSSIYTTTETVLAAYADPGVLASAYTAEITPSRLLDGGAHTLYLCAPSHEQQRLRPLFTTLIQLVSTAVYERVAFTGRPLDPPLLIVLDEAANIAPLDDLDTLASTAAGQGIQLISIFQDVAQIKQRWGIRAPTILNNHRAKLIGSGVSDPDTLEYAARVLGDQEVRQLSQTAGLEGNASTTESSIYRALAPPHELRQAPAESALLIYGNLPPARLRLRPWFNDRHLRRLAAATPTTGGSAS